MLKQKYFLTGIFILSAERQPIKLAWRKIVWLHCKALIKDRYSDIREVTIEGKGQGTVSLIKETIAIRDKSNKEFDRVWAVFDKDDFNDFNE